MMQLLPHPAADAFPMMEDKRFEELKTDLITHGQIEPITLCDGLILDGRNRYKACIQLGIKPVTRNFNGDPWAYVWSLNGERRDLKSEDQRYLIWKWLNEKSEAMQSEIKRIADEANKARSEAQVGIPKAEKQRAGTNCARTSKHPERQAKATASKTNAGAVARGDKLAKDRPDLEEKVRKGEMKPVEAHRQMKRDAVADKVSELPTDQYRIIYADPPWKYGDKRDGHTTGAEDHYPTLSISELCALPVKDMAATDAVLFLWVTSPMLEDAFSIIKAWGFQYKTSFVWDKIKHNMGHYNSVRHEFLLVCTRGSCTPDNSTLFDSVQSIERTEHSMKPERFREIIDTLYVHGKKIELFRRGTVLPGWDAWGNETHE